MKSKTFRADQIWSLFTDFEDVEIDDSLRKGEHEKYSLEELQIIIKHNLSVIALIQLENENIENFIKSQNEK